MSFRPEKEQIEFECAGQPASMVLLRMFVSVGSM
jgi:hypothetical protein